VVPHFRFKKNLILHLNSSRAAPKVGIFVSLQQAGGNSNLNMIYEPFSKSKCPMIDEQDFVREHYPKRRKATQLQTDMGTML
jgi:hypothetical protein